MSRIMLLLVVVAALAAQNQPPLSQRRPAEWKEIQALIHSSDWQVREKGFHAVADYECADPDATAAAFELLQIENSYVAERSAQGIGVAEGWSDPYYSDLLAFTFSCFKKAPRPEWFRQLALSRYNPESAFARKLSGYVGDNLQWLLTVTPAQNSQYQRASLYSVLVMTLLRQPAWKAGEREAVLAVAERGLSDPELYVVMSTAGALSYNAVPEGRDLLLRARPRLVERKDMAPVLLRSYDNMIARVEGK